MCVGDSNKRVGGFENSLASKALVLCLEKIIQFEIVDVLIYSLTIG